MIRQFIPLLALTIGLFICGCQTDDTLMPAENGNSLITGKILLSDGKTPASGVRVSMRLKSATARIFDTDSKDSAVEIGTATNENGFFSIDSAPHNGIYVIEASGANGMVLIDSIVVDGSPEKIIVPPGIMKPAGAIRGTISAPAALSNGDVFILVRGITRFVPVLKNGSFLFENIPQGLYGFRIVTTVAGYGSRDLMNVPVVSGDTIDIGAIDLPYTSVSVPFNLRAVYDTLNLTVEITWDPPENGNRLRYAVYRKCAGSLSLITEEVIDSSLDNTIYVDSFLAKEATYEYRVAAVDQNGKKSLKSDPAIVHAISYLKHDSALVEPYSPVRLDSSVDGTNGISDWYTEEIAQNGEALHYAIKWVEKDNIWVTAGGGLISMKLCDEKIYTILGCSMTGEVIEELHDTLYCDNIVSGSWVNYAITDNFIYVMERKYIPDNNGNGRYFNDSILVFNRSGGKESAWDCGRFNNCLDIAGGDDDRLYVLPENSSTILVYDRNGSVADELPVPQNCMREKKKTGWQVNYSLAYSRQLGKLFLAAERDGRLILWIYDDKSEPYVGYFGEREEYQRIRNMGISVTIDGSVQVSFDTNYSKENRTKVFFRFP